MKPSDLTLRQARVEDAASLAQAARTIAKTPGFLASEPSELRDEQFIRKIAELAKADNGKYLVAETGGTLVGHAILDPLPLAACRHVVQLTLVVHPGFQGKGIGKALLGKLIEWAKSTPSVEKIELNVRSTNTVARKLYEKFNFEEVGCRKRRLKVGPGIYLDDVTMELWVK